MEADSGSRHLAHEDLCTTSAGIANGKDLSVGLSRRVSLPHGIVIHAIIVGANQHQGCKHNATYPLKDQEVHPMVSLIEAKR